VLSGFGHREELSAAGADLILESVRELPAMPEVQAGS
jgi:phosphoglycolate phosphatase-like HAD superfamily hydrolase